MQNKKAEQKYTEAFLGSILILIFILVALSGCRQLRVGLSAGYLWFEPSFYYLEGSKIDLDVARHLDTEEFK